jgi:hypothetical protein
MSIFSFLERPLPIVLMLSFVLVMGCQQAKTTSPSRRQKMVLTSVDKREQARPRVKIEEEPKAPPIAEYQQYFPYSNGRRWEWDVCWYERGVLIVRSLYTESVVGLKRLNNGQSYFRVFSKTQHLKSGQQPARGECYYRIDKRGVFIRRKALADDALYFPFPIVKGKTWSVTQAQFVSQCKVEGLETITVKGRKYKGCLKVLGSTKYVNSNNNTKTITYYAKGIGRVLELTTYTHIGYLRRVELK